MITVIDLKISNITSVSRALRRLGIGHLVSDQPRDIAEARQLILPGVGSFAEAVKRLRQSGLDAVLRKAVLEEKKPILGICLGMQLFASYGEEGGGAEGLNFIRGQVLYHRASQANLRLPHIGWNDVHGDSFNSFKGCQSFNGDGCFYFVHSYEFIPEEPVKVAYSHYGVDFVAAVQKDHILGVQFHPEKSQEIGLKFLDNFCQGNF